MGTAAEDGVRAGGAAGGAGEEGADCGAAIAWVPGTSYRVLPDGSVHRWVTNEGVLLDYAFRLRGAVDEIRGLLADDVLGDRRVAEAEAVLERWGV